MYFVQTLLTSISSQPSADSEIPLPGGCKAHPRVPSWVQAQRALRTRSPDIDRPATLKLPSIRKLPIG